MFDKFINSNWSCHKDPPQDVDWNCSKNCIVGLKHLLHQLQHPLPARRSWTMQVNKRKAGRCTSTKSNDRDFLKKLRNDKVSHVSLFLPKFSQFCDQSPCSYALKSLQCLLSLKKGEETPTIHSCLLSISKVNNFEAKLPRLSSRHWSSQHLDAVVFPPWTCTKQQLQNPTSSHLSQHFASSVSPHVKALDVSHLRRCNAKGQEPQVAMTPFIHCRSGESLGQNGGCSKQHESVFVHLWLPAKCLKDLHPAP